MAKKNLRLLNGSLKYNRGGNCSEKDGRGVPIWLEDIIGEFLDEIKRGVIQV